MIMKEGKPNAFLFPVRVCLLEFYELFIDKLNIQTTKEKKVNEENDFHSL